MHSENPIFRVPSRIVILGKNLIHKKMLNLTLQFPLGQLLQEVLQTRLSLAAKTEPV